ncbi:MAG: 2-amino-4-hydroxy-6-hydroxymethyldihydropteridine diphosphokinase [Acidobacteriota bacterium]
MTGLAYLGLGARDGDRRRAMAEAVRSLRAPGATILRVSSLYETEPIDLPGRRPLLNAAVLIATTLPPEDLLRACRRIEARLGRHRGEPPGIAPDPGPRPIDLDLLLYGDRVISTPELILPHPRMHQRRFVLVPMNEIGAHARHPVLGRDMRSLLENCADRGWVRLQHPARAWWSTDIPCRSLMKDRDSDMIARHATGTHRS